DWRACSGLPQAGMRSAGSRLASPSPPTAATAAARIDSTGWNGEADAHAIGRTSRNMSSRRGWDMRGMARAGIRRSRASRVPRGRAQAPATMADTACMTHNLLNRIDQRTRLAGHNRLALLLFPLGGRQLFGVNVFKVQEVLRQPPLFQLPGLPAQFAGAADVRGRSVPVLDLGLAIGHPERDIPEGDGATQYLVVTEFNRSVQGFLVSDVERIVNIAVEDIHPPPDLGAESSYLTAVTRFQGELIQVLDVESVLSDITQARMDAVLAPEMALPASAPPMQVLVVDDSRVARQQIRSVLDQLGVGVTLLSDGRQALEHLLQVHA